MPRSRRADQRVLEHRPGARGVAGGSESSTEVDHGLGRAERVVEPAPDLVGLLVVGDRPPQVAGRHRRLAGVVERRRQVGVDGIGSEQRGRLGPAPVGLVEGAAEVRNAPRAAHRGGDADRVVERLAELPGAAVPVRGFVVPTQAEDGVADVAGRGGDRRPVPHLLARRQRLAIPRLGGGVVAHRLVHAPRSSSASARAAVGASGVAARAASSQPRPSCW